MFVRTGQCLFVPDSCPFFPETSSSHEQEKSHRYDMAYFKFTQIFLPR